MTYQGKCPKCSSALEYRDHQTLQCSSNPKHFNISFVDYEKAWSNFWVNRFHNLGHISPEMIETLYADMKVDIRKVPEW